ncbi:MAG: D-aminoacylase [Paenibacillaceae bacterium]|nr:D-aminoacylase [Paenibacillaceae bacterium]
MYDVIIRNARVIDGTGSPWYKADVGIIGDRIGAVGKLDNVSAKVEINAAGRVVCPGFIDMHTHSDLYVLERPFLAAKIRQGITTDLLGQDGIAAAPLPPQYVDVWQKNLAGLDGTPEIEWDWQDVDGYLNKIAAAKPSYNVSFLVPHGNIRMQVMGLAGRAATAEELDRMKEVLREALGQGASGLSSGLIYPPCVYAELEEIEALCSVLAEYGAPFVVHQRSEGDDMIESMKDLIGIAQRTGMHLHFSHFKICGRLNWGKLDDVLQLLDDTRAKGTEVTFDQYPYTAGSTMLSAILPPWAHAGGTNAMLDRLADPQQRSRMLQEMAEGIAGWDSISAWAGWEGIYVTSVASERNKCFVGNNLQEIARARGDADPGETALNLIAEEANAVGMIDFVMDDGVVSRIMAHPAGCFGSDGLLGGEPHPRAYGTFPRILGKYVRNEGALSLEDAVRKATSQAARILGLQDRGIIREGLKADMVIFDAEKVIDRATYENSRQYPEGIDYVMVNGRIVVAEGEERHLAAGRVLRRSYPHA